MSQLLIVVITVALAVLIVVGGVTYINFDTVGRNGSAQIATVGFRTWENAYVSYKIANRAIPVATADLLPFLPNFIPTGCRGDDGTVSVAYCTPKALQGLTWSYGADSTGRYICLSGSTNSNRDFKGIAVLSNPASQSASLNNGSLDFGPSCGVNVMNFLGTYVLGNPIAVTYRITS